MENISSYSSLSSELEPAPSFNVVIAYEDFQTGTSAKKTYDYLVAHLDEECQFESQMWKFDVLALPKLRDMAVKDALKADIVIVSSRGGDLPVAVRTWLETWSTQDGSAIALVALCEGEFEQANITNSYLASVAQRAGLEFFSQPPGFPRMVGAPEERDARATSQLGRRTLSTLAGVVQGGESAPRWEAKE